ncbi:amino acid ABC transporter membrane protein 2 (PAAT family) [Humitalea rosea]|uniref:Amino acid ABC transporter membrane protein 2 (PAAT family) n=1 Tax=Humitalea rosea TaxID=990373 RepID=A0A2W7IJ40_9PROT|nr:amino acid ABC transporter permease [Humitalea rosea]PZW46974.1 amino acid ABC transporter membrane protein 2 (PAAT family) [Humitalea rosea]
MSDALIFQPKAGKPAPPSTLGVVGWVRGNLVSSLPNAALTLLGAYIVYAFFSAVIGWAIVDAVWEAQNRRECLDLVGRAGACWPGVKAWIPNLIYGLYPKDQVWRINAGFLVLVLWAVPLFLPWVRSKVMIGLGLVLLYPLLASYFFHGGDKGLVWGALIALGLTGFLWSWLTAIAEARREAPLLEGRRRWILLAGLYAVSLLVVSQWVLDEVQTRLWGGLFLTLVISGFGITVSLPAGILLALGRRSRMPLIAAVSTTFIELFRSVPLITVLFMFNTMLPLFLPAGVEVNRLLRAIVAVCLFSSAYMAEIVRGGLQAIPKGQYEAAAAVGLGFWQSTSLIVLPQALRIMIPSIVGSFIGLFKDTTLVSIIGLFDLLSMARAVGEDTVWLGLFIEPFFFVTMIYFVFCFSMSQYSFHLEARLGAGQRR